MVNLARLNIRTDGNGQILDITSRVSTELSHQPMKNGTVTLFALHSTVGLTTIECESGLLRDFQLCVERLVPKEAAYQHNKGGEDNGHSHLRASLVGPSLTIPFQGGKLLLGTWQQVVLVDFDTRPRTRELALQFMGE